MWVFQTRIAARSFGFEVTWGEVPLEAMRLESDPEEPSPSLIVVGIERSLFINTAAALVKLRETQSPMSETKRFLVAWYPDGDIESRRLCLELGCDAVLYEAAQVAGVVRRVINSA